MRVHCEAEQLLPAWLSVEGLRGCMPMHSYARSRTGWSLVSDDSCTPCSCPVKPVNRAELSGEHGTGFAPHRCGYNYERRWVLHQGRSMTDGFTSTSAVPELGHTEHRHGVCSDSASQGASPRDPGSYNSLSRRAACAFSSCRRPTCSGSLALCTSSLSDGHGQARRLSILPLRAEDG
jgi:hypothetical protein